MTDSTCDLPQSWIARHDIRVVPTYVHFGLESLADDGVQLTRQDFYRRLSAASELPKTSAPPPGQVLDTMKQALADAEHVIAITAPAKLSAIFSTFRLAADQSAPERVTLIDSGTVSMALGWLVMLAAERAGAGASPSAISAEVRAAIPSADLWAALDTLEYVRRSGRVGWATALVGELFHIKPVIRLYDGVVSSVTRTRTAQRSLATLVELARGAAPLERLAVMHSNHPQGGQQLAEALSGITPAAEIVVVDITPVLGVHVGPKALGIAVLRKAQPER
jgi:DegV family protein with EDD domain